MAKRIQSPSSINTFKQCPRKYYYQYILKAPTKPSIHLVRGRVVHSVLEDIYDEDVSQLTLENYKEHFQACIGRLFVGHWNKASEELETLGLNENVLAGYFEESVVMLFNWLNSFCRQIAQMDAPTFQDRFEALKPQRELQFYSEKHQVRGFIDAIQEVNGQVHIVDYKTSKRDKMTSEYRLQLAIYSLMYFEKYGRLPHKAGLFFLKHGARDIDVDASLLQLAVNEIAFVHAHTESEDINDYPKNVTALCRWRTGQCDFYAQCFQNKPVDVPLSTIRVN